MIDTHCHLTFPELAADVPALLSEAAGVGVAGAITICTTTRNAPEVLAVAERFANVWCSAGVHPLYSDPSEAGGPHEWERLRRVIAHPRCVAWGELGLDNHYKEPAAALQRRVLEEQLAFIQDVRAGVGAGGPHAPSIDKPIVLHCREAFDDLIPILRATGWGGDRFVFHCFTGGPADMRKVLDFGAMVSFTGVVTYPSAPDVRAAARLVPLDRMMVETDAPFLSPVPYRGKRPCRPAWVRHTAEELARLRGESWELFHGAINANSERFFALPRGAAGGAA